MSEPRTERPLVTTAILTEYGEVLDDASELFDEQGANMDTTYVPGISDMRRTADLARARGQKATPLPVQVRWVRRTKVNGQPTNERTIRVSNNGYRVVTKDDLPKDGKNKHDWITGLPPAGTVLPDGSIGNADYVLMVCDGKRAARNEARKRVKWLEQNTASADEAFRKAGERIPGSAVEVTTEKGPVLSR